MQAAWIFLLFQLSCFALKPVPPLNIASITSKNFTTLEHQTKAFGLQDALNSYYQTPNGAITLFPDACIQNDGTPNCTAACLDNTQMFSNLETLHNCAVFPNISVHLANDNVSAGARRLAEELKIEPSSKGSTLPSSISNAIQRCLLDSCENNPDCKDTLNPSSVSNKNHSPDDLTGILFANTYLNICGPITAYVNADVGGIGVFISYIMQMGLALLAFIVTIPWSSIIRGFRTGFVYCLAALSPQRRSSRAKQYSQVLSVQSNRKYPEALIAALVAFQKAQCFFMLATNIAGFVIEQSGGLAPQSLQQLYNTYIFIKVIAIGGFLPITFTLLNLHIIKQLSWYLLTLSIMTIAVATTTLTIRNSSFMPTQEDFDQIMAAASQGGPSSCASQNLAPSCFNPQKDGNYFGFGSSSNGDGANAILVFCLITLAVIVADHFCRSDDPNQQNINRWILESLGIATSKPLFPHASTILHFGTAAFHFIFFWLYIYCFYIFGGDLDWFSSNNIYDPSWGFGQIVAILVWAPTLCDYLWDQIRGIPKGFEHRLSERYEVIKRE